MDIKTINERQAMKLNERELHVESSSDPSENKLLSKKSIFPDFPMRSWFYMTTGNSLIPLNIPPSFFVFLGY